MRVSRLAMPKMRWKTIELLRCPSCDCIGHAIVIPVAYTWEGYPYDEDDDKPVLRCSRCTCKIEPEIRVHYTLKECNE